MRVLTVPLSTTPEIFCVPANSDFVVKMLCLMMKVMAVVVVVVAVTIVALVIKNVAMYTRSVITLVQLFTLTLVVCQNHKHL